MSIEDQMEQVVVQLTRIGDFLESHGAVANGAAQKAGAATRAAAKSKSESKRVAVQTKQPDLKEPLDAPEPVTGANFGECNGYFFNTLVAIKEHKGLDVAKTVCTEILKKFTGGKPLDKEALPEASYDKFYQEVQRVRANHGIEE